MLDLYISETISNKKWFQIVVSQHHFTDIIVFFETACEVSNFRYLNQFHYYNVSQINYMDKMGKRSPFLTGKYKRPSLRDWDVKTANQDLQKVHELMGLENGLTAGVKRLNSTGDVPVVICFDADTCPLSKVFFCCRVVSNCLKYKYI